MARTVITAQRLQLAAGQAITYQSVDQTNGMQVFNTGVQVLLVKCGAGGSVNVSIPSQVDPYNRLAGTAGSLGPTNVPANSEYAFGPYTPTANWGDGGSQLYFDFSGSAGAPTCAVITI